MASNDALGRSSARLIPGDFHAARLTPLLNQPPSLAHLLCARDLRGPPSRQVATSIQAAISPATLSCLREERLYLGQARARLGEFGKISGESTGMVVGLPYGQPDREDPQLVGAREEALAAPEQRRGMLKGTSLRLDR